jgi:hypothetical protein
MADRNWRTDTASLFSQWAWARRCNITEGRFLTQTLAWRYKNNNCNTKSCCLCSDLPGPGWLAGMGGWTGTSSRQTWTTRYNITEGPSCRWHWLGATTNSTKNSYCLFSDLPGPGWLAGMGGHSLAVYFSHGHGQGAAILQRTRHWLGATIIIIALKIPTVCVQISQGLDGWPEWADGHRQYIFPAGMDEALHYYSGRCLLLALAWRLNNCNSTKIPTVCVQIWGPEWLTGMDGQSPAVYFSSRHGHRIATLERSSYCRRHWLGATTIITALKIPTVCVQISQSLEGWP